MKPREREGWAVVDDFDGELIPTAKNFPWSIWKSQKLARREASIFFKVIPVIIREVVKPKGRGKK